MLRSALLASMLFASSLSGKQLPPGLTDGRPPRPPIKPVEFPNEIPTEPVETPAQLAAPGIGEDASETAQEEPASGEPRAEDRIATWRLFNSEIGQFRVAMPTPPATYMFDSEAMAVDSRMYIQMQLVSASRLEIYAAAFVESTEFIQAEEDLSAALVNCVNSLVEQTAAPPDSYEALALGPYRGVEASVIRPDGGIQVSRCYLAGDRAYLLSASGEPFDPGSGLIPTQVTGATSAFTPERSVTMSTFFDSFEILDDGRFETGS
ncbi:MAG: hypothetical protein AAFY72_08300 [Cyanobacteria bacterium J06649_4]